MAEIDQWEADRGDLIRRMAAREADGVTPTPDARHAWGLYASRYGNELYVYLRGGQWSGMRSHHPDIWQMTYIRLLEKAPSFRGGSARSFVKRICYFVALEHWRREGKHGDPVRDPPDKEDPAPRVPPEEPSSRVRALWEAIKKLPPKQREAIEWHLNGESKEGLTDKQVAALRQNLSRAKKRLKKYLGPGFEELL